MTGPVPQSILDALTDIPMPRLPADKSVSATLRVGDLRLPVSRAGALIVGSGAAGLRAAVELKRRGIDVMVLSQSAWGGTSACSGSDKQTLHTANTSDQGDDFCAMARAIRGGGAMDEDTAYVEAVGSARMMASLQYMGLPLPQERFGGTLRYQTDHDETGRATSCGPRTSRLMVKVLAEEALRLGIPVLNHTTAVRLLTRGRGKGRQVAGLVAVRNAERTEANPAGFALFLAPYVVLAAGGPGELYRDSVYPNGCFGSLGLAIEAGIACTNLTESQFGIGTRREGFPWNLSGTYVQAMPHIYSVDAAGQEHHFLAGYYRSTQEMVSNIFRKGYQWPFHASRMLDFGSSLVDLAIWREGQAGRRVFMDFNRNPLPVPGDQGFSLERLDADVASYLGNVGASQSLPIDRLRHMNPLSIELYRRYKVDLVAAPLEFAVNNQHMNGGIDVDVWGRSSLAGCYAVGEAAGTHGVTRPGGAALNAGQVFGTRAAEHIAGRSRALGLREEIDPTDIPDLTAVLSSMSGLLRQSGGITPRSIKAEVQARMSDAAGILCTADGVASALTGARKLNNRIATEGITCSRPSETARALQWAQMALASEAVLTALDSYISAGGGSRGARAICDPAGGASPSAREHDLSEFRFRAERVQDRDEQIVLQRVGNKFKLTRRENRRFDETRRVYFERDWPDWLTGAIYLDRPADPRR